MDIRILLHSILLICVAVCCTTPEDYRLKLKELGYDYDQDTFRTVVRNGDLTAMEAFIESGFKPSRRTINYIADNVTCEEYKYILENFQANNLNIYQSESLYRTVLLSADYCELNALKNIGLKYSQDSYDIMEESLSDSVALSFVIHEMQYDVNKIYQKTNSSGDTLRLLPIWEVLLNRDQITGEERRLDEKEYSILRILVKNGASLSDYSFPNEDGSSTSLLELRLEMIKKDAMLRDIFSDEIERLNTE